MTSPADIHSRARAREGGFTLIEMLVVICIVLVLAAAAYLALRGAKVESRAKAMQAAAGNVGQAVSAFNRMRPPINGQDPLVAQSTWTSTQTEAAGGLYSTTGELLLDPWPKSPYTGEPMTIRRQLACPATVPSGEIVVCRPTAGRAAFRVMAGARSSEGPDRVIHNVIY